MKFSERWLRSFVDPSLSTAELAHALTMAGLEVESLEPAAPPCSGVVVAEILEVARHPNAERLSLCRVNVGEPAPLTIVCGAPNVLAGMRAPCALVGARLTGADGLAFEIKRSSLRGVDSQGMLCSAKELGIDDDHAGLLPLAADAPIGGDVRELLELDDTVFTLKLTPNRADCLSLLGVAREVAAITGASFNAPAIAPVAAKSEARHPVNISAADGCGRFAARVIRNVDAAAPVPAWMKQRLARAGQRSISALVDVTNYVMLELGRPLHVYDLDKLTGGIDVRFGRKGERLKLLNEQNVEVDETVLCITDASGPIGLAGIMGGDSTKAETNSRNIFLESAFFYPDAVAGRARRYNFTSDAAHRFERGVDFDNNVAGIERATELILAICGGEPGPTADHVAQLPERKPVHLRSARAARVLGIDVGDAEIAAIFSRLGLSSVSTADGFEVTPPSYRFDIAIEEDLIEEIARIYGYERIPAKQPRTRAAMSPQHEAVRPLLQMKEAIAARDYQEVINFSFVETDWERDFCGNDAPVKLLNPISSQLSVMRSGLAGSLVANVRYNLNRKQGRVRLFELGRVFRADASVDDGPLTVAGIAQPLKLAAIAYGPAYPEQWGLAERKVDFYDVKGDIESLLARANARFEPTTHPALHPGRAAKVLLDEQPIGWLGELHPRWQQKYELPQAPVLFELDLDALLASPIPVHREVSKFPPVIRDLALVVDESVPAEALLEAMQSSRPALVQELWLFDLYRGKGVGAGKKSLAFRVVMQDTSKTLTDVETEAAMAQLLQLLVQRVGVKLRT
ncbi:MAG: phenylalanine--tRNA ligase subunit beta [Betaproteobacteria bacterium RIFCSPLOWO2_12_FULL_64_23]|nr:MAG: phenylalanine--tRNA ligase subunit beta [Betaproteobacteria bacterium RIFCSPLOWO2_12_FULL_64_23]